MAQTAISKVQGFLANWDSGTALMRKDILANFMQNNLGKTGPELETEFYQSASLFLTRLSAWLRLTYMTGTCVSLQLKAIYIFVSATSGHHFMAEFIEVGGILTLLEIVGLKQSKETDKNDALKILITIASSGRQYKELICESYGIRTVAESMAKSKSEETQENCQILLQLLAQGNPKHEVQVYKSFIALLPCTSPKAQQLALQNLRIVQKIIKQANPSLTEPLLNLLSTVHLEVQYEAIEFIRELMDFDICDSLLEGLVKGLHPSRDDIMQPNDKLVRALQDAPDVARPMPAFVKQASCAKTIGILAKDSSSIAERLLKLQVAQGLLFAMGNSDHANSQRQSSLSLEYFVRAFPSVDESVKQAMGEQLYDLFMKNPEYLYMKLNAVQTDVLVTNKVKFF